MRRKGDVSNSPYDEEDTGMLGFGYAQQHTHSHTVSPFQHLLGEARHCDLESALTGADLWKNT